MSNRIIIIDFIRGIAILLMIIQHVFLSLNVFNKYDFNVMTGILGFFSSISRNLFIILFGISLFLSYKNDKKNFYKKQFKRFIILLVSSLIITILSYFVDNNNYIHFGILHFMALSLFIILLIIHNKYLIYVSFILSYLSSFMQNCIDCFDYNNLSQFIMNIVGIFPYYKSSFDHFSLNKWLYKIIFGIIIGKHVNLKKIDIKNNLYISSISKIGEKSLIIYLAHLPILYILNKIFKTPLTYLNN